MPVALQIVTMRLHSDRTDKRQTAPEVIEAGRALLAAFRFPENAGQGHRDDHDVGVVARASLACPEGAPIARRLCRDLMTGAAKRAFQASDHDELLGALFRTHPIVVLDELFSGDEKAPQQSVQLLHSLMRHDKFVLDTVSDDVLLAWCDGDPAVRYPIAAAIASLFTRPNNNEPRQWMPLALKLLQKAPEPAAVLSGIVRRLMPLGGWSGSLATIFESGLKLLEELPLDDLPGLKGPMEEAKAALRRRDRRAAARRSRRKPGAERYLRMSETAFGALLRPKFVALDTSHLARLIDDASSGRRTRPSCCPLSRKADARGGDC